MMSLMAGSASSSSSGPRPSSSSTSTFSSANCSRRLRLIFSSASTSPMIGRNSSASSSLLSVAAASGSTRSSRRGSTCSLIRWTEASKPSALLLACFAAGVLAAVEAVHRRPPALRRHPCTAVEAGRQVGDGRELLAAVRLVRSRLPTRRCQPPPFIGLATPNCGRPLPPPTPPRLPNAFIPFPFPAVSAEESGW